MNTLAKQLGALGAGLMLAVAVAPAASGDGVASRPVAALVLRLSAGAARARAHVASTPRRVEPPIARASRAAWRERVASPRERSRARVEPDERYLYLSNSTFLC